MDGVERLGQAQQVLVVDPVADPPAAVEVGDVRRAADGPEGDPVATQLDVVGGVPGVERELRRRGLDQLGDHLGIEAHALRIGGDGRAGRAQDLARVGVEEVHPDLGQDAQRAGVDRLELVGGQELGRAVAHPRLGPRRLLRRGVPGVALATAAPTTSEPLARGRVHVRHGGLPQVVASARRSGAGRPPTQL